MYFIFLQSTHCIKKTLTVSCTLLCESDRVKVDESSFSAYLHAVMLRHHCSEYGASYVTKSSLDKIYPMRDSKNGCKNCRQLAALATRV